MIWVNTVQLLKRPKQGLQGLISAHGIEPLREEALDLHDKNVIIVCQTLELTLRTHDTLRLSQD